MTVQNKRPIAYARRFHPISKFKGHLFIGIFTEISGSPYFFHESHLLEFLFKLYRLIGPFCCFEISAPCSSDNYKDIRCADPDLQAYKRLLGAA